MCLSIAASCDSGTVILRCAGDLVPSEISAKRLLFSEMPYAGKFRHYMFPAILYSSRLLKLTVEIFRACQDMPTTLSAFWRT